MSQGSTTIYKESSLLYIITICYGIYIMAETILMNCRPIAFDLAGHFIEFISSIVM